MNTECLAGSCVGAFVASAATPTMAELTREIVSALRLGQGDVEGEGGAGGEGAGSAMGAVPTQQQYDDWAELRATVATALKEQRVALERVPTGGTRACYAHGATTGA